MSTQKLAEALRMEKLLEFRMTWNHMKHGNTKNFHISEFCSQSRNTDRHTEIVIVKSAWCWVSNEFWIWKFHPLLIAKHQNEKWNEEKWLVGEFLGDEGMCYVPVVGGGSWEEFPRWLIIIVCDTQSRFFSLIPFPVELENFLLPLNNIAFYSFSLPFLFFGVVLRLVFFWQGMVRCGGRLRFSLSKTQALVNDTGEKSKWKTKKRIKSRRKFCENKKARLMVKSEKRQ